jgi:hypothetical protein
MPYNSIYDRPLVIIALKYRKEICIFRKTTIVWEEEWIKRTWHSHQPVSVANQFWLGGLHEPFSSLLPLDWSVSGNKHILKNYAGIQRNVQAMGASRTSMPRQSLVHQSWQNVMNTSRVLILVSA